MMYLVYLRIEERAGGASCTDREFLRACRDVMAVSARVFEKREARHVFMRSGLRYLNDARNLYEGVVRGMMHV